MGFYEVFVGVGFLVLRRGKVGSVKKGVPMVLYKRYPHHI